MRSQYIPCVCKQCGKDFSAKPSRVRAGYAKYCSRACSDAGKRTQTEARFWGKINRSGGPDACWPWLALTRGYGYGKYDVAGRAVIAHRYAYELTYGPIPKGLLVRHKCDNPLCCNPRHLITGTHLDNIADKVARGRVQHGEGCYNARLTEDAVRAIRARFVPYKTTKQMLADEYGVSTVTIDRVVRRVAWKHVT